MSDLGAKALNKLLDEFDDHTNARVKRPKTGAGTCSVVADLYHDCDRAPSYTTTDTVLDGLDRVEAEILVGLLNARYVARQAAISRRMTGG